MPETSLTPGLCEALAVFDGSAAPLTTREVADELEVGRRSAYDRLDRLVDAGEIRTKRVGASARIWWRAVSPNSDGEDATGNGSDERRLEERVRQQNVVSVLGQRALEDENVDALFAEAAELVADTLHTDYCKVLDLDADEETLELRQGVGWEDGIVGSARVSAVADDSQAAYTLATEAPVVVEDLTTEDRFSGPALLNDHDVRSGISTIIGPKHDPWGILGTHDTAVRDFAEHDAAFVQSVANVLASAVERHDHEAALRRQREQLAALDDVNVVVREITDAVIEDSTRDEIEATVCEHLVATDSYQFAWVGETDPFTQVVEPRTAAGGEDPLEAVTISADTVHQRGDGPTGRALRTGEMQVTNEVGAAAPVDATRAAVATERLQSAASIPVVHEDTVYGVLNVYASRPTAFEGQEGAVLGHLGEIVGHAIASTERKQALMSDDLVALDFRVPDVFAPYGVDSDLAGQLTFDHVVSAGGEDYVVFGTCDGELADALEPLAETVTSWETISVHRDDDETTFELLLSDPPVLSDVASLGGYVERAVVENGDYRVTVHLSPSTDVRRLTEAVEAEFPDAEMVSRRQITREHDDPQRFQRDLLDPLTDRQRATLETAHHAGFFEWPRDASGEAVAEALGIAPPTFHQHLRAAEKAVFDELVTR